MQNITAPQFFPNIDNSGVDMTLTLSNVMKLFTQPVQDHFVPFIGEGRVLRVWKTSSPTTVPVTITFSEDINLDVFGFGGLRCYSGNCDYGNFTWYGGPNATGNTVTPLDPLSYENINFDNSDLLNSNTTITELDGTTSFSEVVVISASSKGKKDIFSYPNPASHELFINYGKQINKGQIILRNLLGKPVYQSSFMDTQEVLISVSNLSIGIYYLQS